MKRIKSKSGFSLLEMMVTVGIVAIGAMAMSEVMIQNTRNQQKTNFDQQITDTMRELNRILANTDICTANFAGLSPPPVTVVGTDNPELHRLHYLKYNITDGLAPSNVIAQIGPTAPPFRGTKLRIKEFSLMPQATSGNYVTYLDKTTGTGSLFAHVIFEYTGPEGTMQGQKTYDRYMQIFANFSNITPTGTVSFFMAQGGDSIGLAQACQDKADTIAVSLGLSPVDATHHPITGVLGSPSSYRIVQNPYNAVPVAIQDCVMFNANEPIISSCNAMNN